MLSKKAAAAGLSYIIILAGNARALSSRSGTKGPLRWGPSGWPKYRRCGCSLQNGYVRLRLPRQLFLRGAVLPRYARRVYSYAGTAPFFNTPCTDKKDTDMVSLLNRIFCCYAGITAGRNCRQSIDAFWSKEGFCG